MLPDISKIKKLYGFDKKQYENECIHKLVEWQNHDGVTSAGGAYIVRRINDYLVESRCLIVQASAIFYFMHDMVNGDLQACGSEIIDIYTQEIDKSVLGVAMRNTMSCIKSVASQRRLAISVKKNVKKNKITKDWEYLLNGFIDGLTSRLDYLKKTVIPANLESTPMGAYVIYLEHKNINLYEDISLFIENSGSIYDDDDSSVATYKDHVMDVLCNLDPETISMVLEKSKEKMEVRKRRFEKIRESVEANRREKIERETNDCKAVVLSMCSDAGKVFRRSRVRSMEYWAKKYTHVYVVPAGKIEPLRNGYLKKSGSKWSVSNVYGANIFCTRDAAENAAAAFREQSETNMAEIAKVELHDYGFGDIYS